MYYQWPEYWTSVRCFQILFALLFPPIIQKYNLYFTFSNFLHTTFILNFLKVNLNLLSSIYYVTLYTNLGLLEQLPICSLSLVSLLISEDKIFINNIVLYINILKVKKRLLLQTNKANKYILLDSIHDYI